MKGKALDMKRNEDNSQTATLSFSTRKPLIPAHFEAFEDSEDGFFIINQRDESIFKWIYTEKLECNGIDDNGELSRSGRRNFDGTIFPSDFGPKGYYESNNSHFKKCIMDFGGFYIATSKARKIDKENIVNFSGDGKIVDCITFSYAKAEAEGYAKNYAENGEFITEVPCGAAMDCVFEDIFERFYKEVQSLKKHYRTEYAAWNDYAKQKEKDFISKGIYGMHDLIGVGDEMTSEGYGDINKLLSVRCGNIGIELIKYSNRNITPKSTAFALGHRNYKVSDYEVIGCGYRIVLLPQKIC